MALVGLTLLRLSAAAPPAPEADATDPRISARHEFAQAEQAFEGGDFTSALMHFERAFALAPHDAVRFNIAVCLERLGRVRDAALQYDAAAVSTELDHAERRRAQELAARVRERLGTLIVEGEPTGAEVNIDGQRLCSLPCRVGLDPGAHEIVVRSGQVEATRSAEVTPGQTATLQLSALTAATVAQTAPVEALPKRWGPLSWAAGAVALLGVTGTLAFGTQAQKLHERYVDSPTVQTRDRGIRMRNLANLSLGAAILGALGILVDVLWVTPSVKEHPLAQHASG